MKGTFGRETHKHEIEEFNCVLNDIADGLRGNLEKNSKTSLASISGLDIANKMLPNWTNGNIETLIEHYLTTINQIFDKITLQQLFGNNQFSQEICFVCGF